MSSREIAELCGKEHKNVLADVRKMLEELGLSLAEFSASLPDAYGRPQTVFNLPKDLTITLISGYSVPLRHRIVRRWQELEDGNCVKFHVPTTMSEALRLAADQAEIIEKQTAELATAAPKVVFYDRLVDRKTLMTASQVAQKLKMSAVAMNKILEEMDVYSRGVKRARVFKQWFIDAGLGELKQTELGYSQPLFTPSGEAWVVEKMTSEGVVK